MTIYEVREVYNNSRDFFTVCYTQTLAEAQRLADFYNAALVEKSCTYKALKSYLGVINKPDKFPYRLEITKRGKSVFVIPENVALSDYGENDDLMTFDRDITGNGDDIYIISLWAENETKAIEKAVEYINEKDPLKKYPGFEPMKAEELERV